MKVLAVLFAAALLLTGCSSVETHEAPKVDLNSFQHFYIEHRLTDDHHIDDLIVAELKAMGKDASAGPLTMLPDNAEAVITYQDAWEWDFKSYLIAIQINIRRARTDYPLGVGEFRQPTPIPKSPADVVHIVLTKLFKKR